MLFCHVGGVHLIHYHGRTALQHFWVPSALALLRFQAMVASRVKFPNQNKFCVFSFSVEKRFPPLVLANFVSFFVKNIKNRKIW
jgi:hypothetical protein